jgi:large subunit ribosomal protein L1
MTKISKRMKEAYKGLDSQKIYDLSEAVQLIKAKAKAKFDETIDLVFNLNIDTRKSEQNIRGAIVLPHGTGKILKVAVFAKDAKAEEAKKAGADLVGADDLAEIIKGGNLDFDRCIATPDMMALVGTLGKVLGPKGLMPNPKLGTVTTDIAAAVKAAKGGQIEYRAEKAGIIHAGVGKASFSEKNLEENIRALSSAILKSKPEGVKGSYLLKATLSSTMGPSVKLNLADLV